LTNTQILIFILGTVLFLLFTWQFSIKAKRPHGIPRFFAFESILLLVLFSIHVWVDDPFGWNQIVSWLLLFISIPLVVQGVLLLRFVGKPQGDFENTTTLVEIGLYKYIRHPLYSSLLFLGTGVYFKHITVETTILVLINIIALIATAKREEKEMFEKFGEEYDHYMKKTKMFVPFIF
jgi:protein-S-isoprenylcysteine O-methyltransferase Ste14